MSAQQLNLQSKGSDAIVNLKSSILNCSTIRSSKKVKTNNESDHHSFLKKSEFRKTNLPVFHSSNPPPIRYPEKK
jgi:hypothetical protein